MVMNEPSKSANPAGPRRVLFVDDDVKFLETVKELMGVLSEGQWEMFTAGERESGVRAVAASAGGPRGD